ncbi:MAG TPA: MmcQ/YjbR family DNA-binding protein [Kiloniellaceae bacterium]|nr:MmcQ/YjbR family DNA-binding protein [Kiloniellaceae bacterium]
MTREEFDAYCSRFKGATNVVQWGNATVWKIGGKIFAICSSWGRGEAQKIAFKCSDISYRLLCEQAGIAPAPYLARAKWVQLQEPDALDDAAIETYIAAAYDIVAGKLTKAQRKALGL